MIPTRRDLLRALAGGPLLLVAQRPAPMTSTVTSPVTSVNGIVFGVETFSFHDLLVYLGEGAR